MFQQSCCLVNYNHACNSLSCVLTRFPGNKLACSVFPVLCNDSYLFCWNGSMSHIWGTRMMSNHVDMSEKVDDADITLAETQFARAELQILHVFLGVFPSFFVLSVNSRHELVRRNLACWLCDLSGCHGDVLEGQEPERNLTPKPHTPATELNKHWVRTLKPPII